MTGATDARTIKRDAPARRVWLDDSAWFDLVDGFVVDHDAAFARVRDTTPWEQSAVLRYDRYVPERRLVAAVPADRDALLRQTQLHLEATHRVRFTGVAAILYRDGDDFQGLHSDREMRWLDETLIAIVVLGERRPFAFRPRRPVAEITERHPAGTLPDDVVVHPGQGDLLVMGGSCQRGWLHGVPATSTANARISLTWRWTSRRGRPDTAPGYFDGRQYSDRPRRSGTSSLGRRGPTR